MRLQNKQKVSTSRADKMKQLWVSLDLLGLGELIALVLEKKKKE